MKYQNITKDDMKNGDGLRVVLWVSGCSHHCKGCQNPITWDPDDGLVLDQDARAEIFEQLEQDYIAGLTLSGGDPFHESNIEEMTEMCRMIKSKYPDKSIWAYTGFYWEQVKDFDIMKYIDVLVDGEYIEALRDTKLRWRGSSNQKVIDVQHSLVSGSIIRWCE